jgi:hypothetical protein
MLGSAETWLLQVVPESLHELSTPVLLDRVVNDGYGGAAWCELQARVASFALDDLTASLTDGSIVARCAAIGYRVRREYALQREPIPNEIASEAVTRGLARLRDRILIPGSWDPARGRSFEEFFTLCCLGDVVNVYRVYLRKHVHETSFEAGQSGSEGRAQIRP